MPEHALGWVATGPGASWGCTNAARSTTSSVRPLASTAISWGALSAGITYQTVRRLMTLQGTMRPHQIISLLDLGANTMALADHNDHIHVGFHPLFGANRKLGQQTIAVLKPNQWSHLIARLKTLENPIVPTKKSKFAIPAHGRSSDAHKGE